ncbi:MAG: leucine-rich repeat domain-containing protein [Mycoplasma sp.]
MSRFTNLKWLIAIPVIGAITAAITVPFVITFNQIVEPKITLKSKYPWDEYSTVEEIEEFLIAGNEQKIIIQENLSQYIEFSKIEPNYTLVLDKVEEINKNFFRVSFYAASAATFKNDPEKAISEAGHFSFEFEAGTRLKTRITFNKPQTIKISALSFIKQITEAKEEKSFEDFKGKQIIKSELEKFSTFEGIEEDTIMKIEEINALSTTKFAMKIKVNKYYDNSSIIVEEEKIIDTIFENSNIVTEGIYEINKERGELTTIISDYKDHEDWKDGAIKVPDQIDGVWINHISWNAFHKAMDTLKSIELPSQLKEIYDETFFTFTKLTGKIVIPASVVEIGHRAFSGSKITSIEFEGALDGTSKTKRIGYFAFYDCTSLTGTVNLPDSIEDIGDRAFTLSNGSTGVSKFSVSVDNYPFLGGAINWWGNDISKIELRGDSSVIVNSNNLKFNKKTQTIISLVDINYAGPIIIPVKIDGVYVKKFAEYAFYKTKITNVTFEGVGRSDCQLESIPTYLFAECGSIGSFIIPESVQSVGEDAWVNSSVVAITFAGYNNGKSKLISIGSGAFRRTLKLGKVYIPESVVKVGTDLFWSNTNERFYFNVPKHLNPNLPEGAEVVNYWSWDENLKSRINSDGR